MTGTDMRTGQPAEHGIRQWILDIKAPAPWLNANHRTDRRTQTPHRQAWRAAGAWHAKASRIPTLDHAKVLAILHFIDNRRRDAANYAPTLKAVVDGLVDAKVLADDDDTHLTGPDLRRGTAMVGFAGWGWCELVITEIAHRSSP